MNYYNKLIDLTFISDADSFTIKTPRYGRKPNISISGNFTTKTFISNFEIHVTNLFTNKILSDYHHVMVRAGYEDSMSSAFMGEVTNIYTATPGPDKETVIMCMQANLSDWVSEVIDLKLDVGTSLTEIIRQVSAKLGYQEAYIDPKLKDKTLSVTMQANGSVRDIVDEIKKIFTGVNVTIDSNRLYVFPEKDSTQQRIHKLPFLIQAPQFSGGIVDIVAPWNPQVKPGDYVEFPINNIYSITGVMDATVKTNRASVKTIDFNFSTTNSNEMNIQGMCL